MGDFRAYLNGEFADNLNQLDQLSVDKSNEAAIRLIEEGLNFATKKLSDMSAWWWHGGNPAGIHYHKIDNPLTNIHPVMPAQPMQAVIDHYRKTIFGSNR